MVKRVDPFNRPYISDLLSYIIRWHTESMVVVKNLFCDFSLSISPQLRKLFDKISVCSARGKNTDKFPKTCTNKP